MDFNTVNSDISVLAKLIDLPMTPKSVRWQVLDPKHGQGDLGPNDWVLVAVMELENGQAEQLASQSTPVAASDKIIDPLFQSLMAAELNGLVADLLAEHPAPEWRSANQFFRQPLLNGIFVLSRSANRLVLVLATT
ncbi:hypothetical protein FCL47_22255 [Desulfopila sp. IMCC35006]|uniref:hypothetical protein n=1 Tax=Desulfopila sp. IMCC35006 TaxID=2569542 RepID=UPI0010ABDA91|nr:hypothetical protein [Desulfopila sp. IMCC35006]TKB23481.1 hypothetical protein FCL47_22255 [Desulfopila sp. IMCC35006]